MPGLDPGMHEAVPRGIPYSFRSWKVIMDCRVKPGNDAERAVCNSRTLPPSQPAEAHPLSFKSGNDHAERAVRDVRAFTPSVRSRLLRAHTFAGFPSVTRNPM